MKYLILAIGIFSLASCNVTLIEDDINQPQLRLDGEWVYTQVESVDELGVVNQTSNYRGSKLFFTSTDYVEFIEINNITFAGSYSQFARSLNFRFRDEPRDKNLNYDAHNLRINGDLMTYEVDYRELYRGRYVEGTTFYTLERIRFFNQ